MKTIFKVILVLSSFGSLTRGDYNVDIIEYGSNSSHPDIIEIEGKVVSPSRGVFGVTGFVDIKKDIDIETTLAELQIFYSPNGITYINSPFHLPRKTVEYGLNNPYKKYIMEDLAECCTNIPVAEVFVNPLTARYIDCEICSYPTSVFPTGLRPGYYKLLFSITGVPTFSVWVLIKVEPE